MASRRINEVTQRIAAKQRLVERAASDPKFREALERNPKDALSREFGGSVPANVEVHVLTESANSFYVALPPDVSPATELSEADLEAVAGGGGVKWFGTSICIGT